MMMMMAMTYEATSKVDEDDVVSYLLRYDKCFRDALDKFGG